MFFNIFHPQHVWCWRGEVAGDEIIVDRGPGLTILAALLLTEHTPPLVIRADPPGGALGHRRPMILGLLAQVAVAELRVVAVGIEQRIRPMRLDKLSVGHRIGQPAIVGLASELQYPARHRHGNPVNGQLCHERVEPFPGRLACDRYAVARRRTSFSCSNNRIRRRNSRTSSESEGDLPDLCPVSIAH